MQRVEIGDQHVAVTDFGASSIKCAKKRTEILEWIFENTRGRFWPDGFFSVVFFEFDDDATKFKLRWG